MGSLSVGFWKTVRRLRRGKRETIQAVYSKDGTWLTSTEEVVGLWKEHFEETPESH